MAQDTPTDQADSKRLLFEPNVSINGSIDDGLLSKSFAP
jgi:hypothetical protein